MRATRVEDAAAAAVQEKEGSSARLAACQTDKTPAAKRPDPKFMVVQPGQGGAAEVHEGRAGAVHTQYIPAVPVSLILSPSRAARCHITLHDRG